MTLPIRISVLVVSMLLLAAPSASADYGQLQQFGTTGTAPGQLNKPLGLGVGPDGNVFVADALNDRVEEFTSAGAFVRIYGSSGTAPGQLQLPEDALSDGNFLYVSDCYNGRITQYKIGTGDLVRTWGGTTSRTDTTPALSFNCPESLALSPDGLLYVSDTFNQRVVVFAPGVARPLARIIGTPGTGPGQFTQPHGVQIDRDGNLLVGDNDPHTCGISRVQRFAPDGTFLGQFGTPGTGSGQLFCVLDIDQDAAGNILVSDGRGALSVFGHDGTFVRQLSRAVGVPFGYAAGLDSDASCRLFASDREAGVVRVLGFPDAPSCRAITPAPPVAATTAPLATALTIKMSVAARVRFGTPVRIQASCPFSDCRLTATLKARFGRTASVTRLARATRKLTAARRTTFSIRLDRTANARIRRWLRTHRALPVTVELVATDSTQKTVTKRMSTSLRRVVTR